jgi:hypothetical protein
VLHRPVELAGVIGNFVCPDFKLTTTVATRLSINNLQAAKKFGRTLTTYAYAFCVIVRT